jgi:hypothetical protein
LRATQNKSVADYNSTFMAVRGDPERMVKFRQAVSDFGSLPKNDQALDLRTISIGLP